MWDVKWDVTTATQWFISWKFVLTHFMQLVSINTSWKHQKPKVFWWFQGVPKRSVAWNVLIWNHSTCDHKCEKLKDKKLYEDNHLRFIYGFSVAEVTLEVRFFFWGMECHVYSEIVQSFSVKKARPATFLKKRLNFEKFLKTPILIEQHRWLLLFIHFTTHELKGPRFVIALMLLKNIIDDIPIYLFNICKCFNQLSSFLSFL